MTPGRHLFILLRDAGFFEGTFDGLAPERQAALEEKGLEQMEYGRTDHQIEMEAQSR